MKKSASKTMASPMNDVQHPAHSIPRRTPRPGLTAKTGIQKGPSEVLGKVSPPLLLPTELGGRSPHLRPSPAFLCGPRPGRPLSPARFSPLPPTLCAAELPRAIAELGPKVAVDDSFWVEGPKLMASALGVHIPHSGTQLSYEESTTDSVADEEIPVEKPTNVFSTAIKSKPKPEPLTGMDMVKIFMKKRHLGKLKFVHLKANEGNLYRPYDLHVVPHDQAGSEHYIFSPSSVLHVRDGCSVGFQTLAEWHREAMLWNILQGLPFFRHFMLRRAFLRWRGNVRQKSLQHNRCLLRGQLLMAVPQFREALQQISRLIEELKQIHWLPQDDSQSYTLHDFHSALLRKTKEAQALLKKFLQYQNHILNMVRADSYRAQWELQQQLEQMQVNQPHQPLHLQRAHQLHLRQDLDQAESAVEHLGNMAALVNYITVQNLVTIIHQEVTSFVRNVATRTHLQQCGLFSIELVFGADGHLTLVPPLHQLQDALQGALLSVADSILQVFDSYSLSPESSDMVIESTSHSTSHEMTTGAKTTCNKGASGSTGPSGTADEPRNSMSCPMSPIKLVLPNMSPPRVEGRRLQGHYYPLSRRPLEWQLTVSSVGQEAQRELSRITQEALMDIQQLCEDHSWLVDVHLTCSQWSSASLEAMKGWPSHCYQQHIQGVRTWAERVRMLPDSYTTSNKLITIHCSLIRESIAPWLTSMEEEVKALLLEEVRHLSESLVSELKSAADWLRMEPTDLANFSQYTSRVKQYEKMCGDLQHRQHYLQCLLETVSQNYRAKSPEETTLEVQVQEHWKCFLLLLKHAEETVRQHTLLMAHDLQRTFSSLTQQLHCLVSQAASGPCLDPSQETALVMAQLQSICSQFCTISAQLDQLSETSVVITGIPLDLSFVAIERQKLEARKGLWELLSVVNLNIQEWRQQLFNKFKAACAQEKVEEWLKQASLLERTIPPGDAVLKHTVQLLEGFGQLLPLLAQLCSPTLKHKHWKNILKGMGLLYTQEFNLTIADLYKNTLDHWNIISKVCRDARAEASMEQNLRKLQHQWEGTLFRLANFLLTTPQGEEMQSEPASRRMTPNGRVVKQQPHTQQSCDSGTYIIIGLETLAAQTEDSIMTLSSMLTSPHIVEVRQEVEHWVQRLQELEELLDVWKRYQLKWAFLSKMFYESRVTIQKPELHQRFLPVDKTYREIIQTMSSDSCVLNFLKLGQGYWGLQALLLEGLSTMEEITNQLLYLLAPARDRFPRLCFLSDGEVMELLSLHPTPFALLPLVRKCFQGVCQLEFSDSINDSSELEKTGLPITQVWGVFGGLGERVPFLCPLEPSLDPLTWLCQLEQQLFCAIVQLMAKCALTRKQCQGQEGIGDLHQERNQSQDSARKIEDTPSPSPPCLSTPLSTIKKDCEKNLRKDNMSPMLWDLVSGFPLQCLLVVEEALWCREVHQAFLDPEPEKRALLKAHYCTKLWSLCQVIRNRCVGCTERLEGSKRTVAVLRAMVQLCVKHSHQLSGLMELECDLESSFEWQRLMKYHLGTSDKNTPFSFNSVLACGNTVELSCYVDILSSSLHYSFEYLGPEHWTMVSTTSSDQAALGIFLALTNYRCGFVKGPHASGKTETVRQLGQALGRQMVTLTCCQETSPTFILQMLKGALQTGAWLILDSVDSMTQGALSILGQHLSDIHQHFSLLLGHDWWKISKTQRKGRQACAPRNSSKGGDNSIKLEILLAGKIISAKPGYGCLLISSSNGYKSEVPENLRAATRPISLLQPDYRVIAEVTLAALGFSDAASIAHRLVSLFSLAKDSACLPESIGAGPTSWLVVLNKVLTIAGTHLNCSLRMEWEKDRMMETGQEAQLLNMVMRAPEGLEHGPQGIGSAHFKRTNQCVAVLWAIAEEHAIIKAVTSAVASNIIDPSKTRHFYTIFHEIFPSAHCHPYCQQGREEEEQAVLKAAVMEEMQEAGLQLSPCMLSNALSLYQALKLSQAVILVGLAGSGKKTCRQTLARALRRLAAQELANRSNSVPFTSGKGTAAETTHPALAWSSVDTTVIFPNSLSIKELWGGCYAQQNSWWDGALTKVLRERLESSTLDSSTEFPFSYHLQKKGKKVGKIQKEKWLVLDGDPLGCPGWMDPLCTLCNPVDPFLCLPTGEKLHLLCEELKILIEATDLQDASPSVVTHCSIVHHCVEDLWRAIWKAELEALHREPCLDQWVLSMWSQLADDLFTSTLTFFRERAFISVLPERGERARDVTQGVQEVMSFIRVLRALFEQLVRNRPKATPKHNDEKQGTPHTLQKLSSDRYPPSAQQELEAQNIFMAAYVWGFGGHLHPRHRPQFEECARDVLYRSRYRVEVPAGRSVFEHFTQMNDKPIGGLHCRTKNRLQSRSLQMTYITIPQYERYAALLRLMLKSRQPVLVVGESGSGKTTLCRAALGSKLPYLRLPFSSQLRAADLRHLLEGVGCQTERSDTMITSKKQPGLRLFVDDLHEAPCDVFGKEAMALETLRHCVSECGVLTPSGCRFKLFKSGVLSFLATCGIPGEGRSSSIVVSPRLSRLFSILVLPCLSVDLVFSMHLPKLQVWMNELPTDMGDMADCIIEATLALYHTVCKAFPPCPEKPHFLFSLHDLQKVFQGICMSWPSISGTSPCLQALSSSVAATVLTVARLWMHECLRTFGDRLCSEEEGRVFVSLLAGVSKRSFGSKLQCFEPQLGKEREEPGSSGPIQDKVIGQQMKNENQSPSCDQGEGEEERMSSREQYTVSSLELEDEDLTEKDELWEISDKGRSSDSSILDSMSDEAPLSEIPTEEPEKENLNLGDNESVNQGNKKSANQGDKERENETKKEKVNQGGLVCITERNKESQEDKEDINQGDEESVNQGKMDSVTQGDYEISKDTRPLDILNGKRNGKLNILLQQCTSVEPPAKAEKCPPSTATAMQLLCNLGATLQDVVFVPYLSRLPHLSAQSHNPNHISTYQEQDLGVLMQQLAATMNLKVEERDGNDFYSSHARYGVHRQGVRQLAHILRALRMPSGHGCLFGTVKGTGRKTTVRLGAQLMGYRMLEVHSGNERAIWERLKEASINAGVQGGGLVLLVHDNTSQVFREELVVAMANRSIPGLYSYKKWKRVTQKLNNLAKGSQGHGEDGYGTEKYFRQIPWNTHVFLLLPLASGNSWHVGEPSAAGRFMARALSLCCCVEVYQPWTSESLTQVATHCLKTQLQMPLLDTKVDHADLMSSISTAMAGIHQSAWKYASVLTPDLQPFKPQTYTGFTAHFQYICKQLNEQWHNQAKRVAAILARMKEMTEKTSQYRQEVLCLRSEFTEAQQYQVQLQQEVDDRQNACEHARQHCLLEENRLAHLEEQLQEAHQQSQDALQQVSPLYQAGFAAMQSLRQLDLDELRRYRRPPEGVTAVMDIICILFKRPCSWECCQQLLGQPNFLQELEFYDYSLVRGELFEALSKAVREPGFQPEAVRGASQACESLCRWAHAVYQYAIAARCLAPLEARRRELEERTAESRARLREGRLQEEDTQACLEEAQTQLQGICHTTEELENRLREAETQESNAATTVQQAAPLMAKWKATAQEIEVNNGTIPGDALLLAAAIAYLGPFEPDVRSELLEKWRNLCLTGGININPEDPRSVLLSAPPSPTPLASPYIPIPLGQDLQVPMTWLVDGVQGGVQGTVKGMAPWLLLKLLLWGHRNPRAQHCPLLVNSQLRQEMRTMLSSAGQLLMDGGKFQEEFDLAVSADDPTLLEKLTWGSEKGVRVLVTHMERAHPSPALLELLCRQARISPLEILHHTPSATQPGFTLMLSTTVPVRSLLQDIHPLILAEVQVVDLSLSVVELQEVMLAEIVQSGCPKLWSQNCQTKTDRQMLLDGLHQQEESLMDYIIHSSTPLLQDPHFLPYASACQSTISSLRVELLDLNQELKHFPTCLRNLAELATAFYQALQDVARLSPLYLFPLHPYLLALHEAMTLQEMPNIMCGGEMMTGVVSAEVLASHLLAHYRPSLFQDHALLLRLLVSVAMSQCSDGDHSLAERAAFLWGLGDNDFSPGLILSKPHPPATPPVLPSWVPLPAQQEVLRLERLPPFKGLVSSLTSCSWQWLEYLRYPSSTVVGQVPCPSHSHLSALQRTLLWKTLLPHWLAAVADDLAACQLGKPFQMQWVSALHPGTHKALSQVADKTKTPIILILPNPNESKYPPIHPLSFVKQAAQCPAGNKGVQRQVICFGTTCHREAVLAALDIAVQEGHWLVFNNCHLLEKWDEEVVCQVTQLVSCTDRGYLTDSETDNRTRVCRERQVHPCFRLWFITQAHTPLSIPVAVRLSSLHLVCDSPWDLKEALHCSLHQAVSAVPPIGGAIAAEPLLRCAVLHSVLLQRQAYRHLGHQSLHYWTQEDLQALMEVQVQIASICDDPVGAMEYIAGSLIYGSHMDEPEDLDAVKGVVRACLRKPPPLWGRGPHTLSELISTGDFGHRDLLQDVEQRIQALSSSDDPLLLGLSAGLVGELVRMRSRTLHILLRESQTPRAQNLPTPLPHLLTEVQARMQALKDRLKQDEVRRLLPAPQTPLRCFLLQEWDGLVQEAASLRSGLQDTNVTSTLHTLSWLEGRAELLGAYLWKDSPETTPYIYRLSAFHNPRGFLAALLRDSAKTVQEDIALLTLCFQVLSAGKVPDSLPQSGAYLCGLELQGALWDTRLGALQDTLSHRPCALPVVWVRAQLRAPKSSNCSPPLYYCPLYLEEGFGEGSIIIHVPLAAKMDPVLCAMRRVRLVSTLRDRPRPSALQ